MTFLDKLERKYGNSNFPNLIYVFVGALAAGFVLNYIAPAFVMYLCFSPAQILKGQVWRLFTYIIMMPSQGNLFMTAITCFIYISIARSLEQIISRFRLNAFLVIGWLMQIIAGFLFWFVMPQDMTGYVFMLNPYYNLAMLFVLFAMIFPDARFLLMFIIPVRGKWMIYITLALYVLDVFQAFRMGVNGYAWILVFMIVAAILTLVVFMLLFNKYRVRVRKRNVKMQAFKNVQNSGTKEPGYRHKCAVCGRTEKTNPELEFRYCTKCAGNYEYCSEHLYTHIHRTVDGNGQ